MNLIVPSMTQDELIELMRSRFGDDPLDWTFECPRCHDFANGHDFAAVVPKGDVTKYLGLQCYGRVAGALGRSQGTELEEWMETNRGCDWCAFGLFPGPLQVWISDERSMAAFNPAPPWDIAWAPDDDEPEDRLRQWSLGWERAHGFDSIDTVISHYDVGDESGNPVGMYACVHPGCGFRRKDAVKMWRHVHGRAHRGS